MKPINFDEIDEEEKSFSPLPEGSYMLTVEQVEEKQSKNGNDYWSIEFSVKGQDKRKIFDNLVFTENTLGRVKKYFKCLGVKAEGTYTPVTVDLIGKSMKADVTIENYIGKDGTEKQKNAVNIWNSEAINKVDKDVEELPF